jgi:hypothetical protein
MGQTLSVMVRAVDQPADKIDFLGVSKVMFWIQPCFRNSLDTFLSFQCDDNVPFSWTLSPGTNCAQRFSMCTIVGPERRHQAPRVGHALSNPCCPSTVS